MADRTIGMPLSAILSALGPRVLNLRVAPRDPAIAIRATVIEDPGDTLPPTQGGLLLLVGVDPATQVALRSLSRAAEQGFAAVVVKSRGGELDAFADAASAAGIAVLVAANEVPWRHLDGLLSSAMSSGLPDLDCRGGEQGDELFSIANAVAAVVGGSVAIEDLAQHVVAYSNLPGQRIDPLRQQGILDRRVPTTTADRDLYRQVLSAEGTVRFPTCGEELARVAIAIRAGTVALGTLWAIEGGTGNYLESERTIIEGARLAALHMMRARSTADFDQTQRADVLRSLLGGGAAPAAAWSRLGFATGDRATLVAVAPKWAAAQDDAPLVPHVASTVNRVCASFQPDAVVTLSTRAVYVLVARGGAGQGARGGAGEAARRLASRLATAVDSDGVAIAISSEVVGPTDFTALRNEVDQILRVTARERPGTMIATMADVQSRVLLLQVGDALQQHPELGHPAVRRLLEMDKRNGTSFAASLRAWLDAQGDVRAAAKRLRVHPNTLRYRLRRIGEMAPIDIDDPDERFALWLQLRVESEDLGLAATVAGGRDS